MMTLYDKNTPVINCERDKVIYTIIQYVSPLILKESHCLVNAAWDFKDCKSELIAQTIKIVNYMYNKGIEEKKIRDIVNMCCTGISNHVKNLKLQFKKRPDYSINNCRIDELVGKEEDEVVYVGKEEDKSDLIIEESSSLQFLTWLLSHGYSDEYVIMRETLYPRIEIKEKYGDYPNIMDVCKYFKISKEYSLELKKTIKARALQFGINKKSIKDKVLAKSVLMGYGIIENLE